MTVLENKKLRANIDADILQLRYQLGAVLSKGSTVTIGGKTIDVPQSNSAVEKYVKETIESIIEATGATEIMCYLSKGKNFRFDRATIQPYKGNRRDFVKPYHWATVGEVIQKLYPTTICEGFEADDFLARDQDIENRSTVLCSRDKDLRGVGGLHYQWSAGDKCPEVEMYWLPNIDATRWFYTQLLTGDSTDNILGCATRQPDKNGKLRRKGVGKGTATKLLASASTESDMFRIVAGEYVRFIGDGWIDAMKENGTLLYMHKEMIPWEELPEVVEMFKEYNK